MYSYEIMLLIICPLVFIAGFIDSIAGGGGLISMPAYVIAGVPVHVAYGTNKFVSSIGMSVATFKYFKSGNIKLKPALISAVGALIGSGIGAYIAILLDEKYLKYCLIIILPMVAVFLLFNRGFGNESKEVDKPLKVIIPLCFVIGFVLGGYDGFFGPGTGTFLTIAFTTFCGFNIITASGNTKVVNLASNLAALFVFIINGKVWYAIGIPAAICGMAGNYLGASLAIKNGAKFIKPVIVLVIVVLFGKIIMDFVG
ncbi:MAG: TSUP family transporter [Clostridium sp.]|uniref:sulfite exporter TauE/SafE family protein n=1 Tax=Clostridium sp. TaxID=1506 RepID=UPI002FC714EE